LAITEPWAGSDVSAIKTSAVKSECGKFYIVNGMKKWITNGVFCDIFTTAVKTDDTAGMFGISLLVLEKNMPGFSVR
jgi:alkylation response protein AidB-like acyl-CoA dehydrogenase